MEENKTKKRVLYAVIGLFVATGIAVAVYYIWKHFHDKNCCGDVCNCPDGQNCVNKKCILKDNMQWSPSTYTALKSKIVSAPAASKITDQAVISCITNNLITKYSTPDKANSDVNFMTELQKIIDGCTSNTITDPGIPDYCKATCGTDKCNISDGCGGTCNCSDQTICDDDGTCKPPPDHWTDLAYNDFKNSVSDGLKDVNPPVSQEVINCTVNSVVKYYPNPRDITNDKNTSDNIQKYVTVCVKDPSVDPGKPNFNGNTPTSTPTQKKHTGGKVPVVTTDPSPSVFKQCLKKAIHSTAENCKSSINNCAAKSSLCTDSNCKDNVDKLADNYCSSIHYPPKKTRGGGGQPNNPDSIGTRSFCYSSDGNCDDFSCKTVESPSQVPSGVQSEESTNCSSGCPDYLCHARQAMHAIF